MSNVYIRSQNREKLYAFGICFNCLQYEEKHDCNKHFELKGRRSKDLYSGTRI